MKNVKRGKKFRRSLSMLLTLAMVLSMCSITAFAANESGHAHSYGDDYFAEYCDITITCGESNTLYGYYAFNDAVKDASAGETIKVAGDATVKLGTVVDLSGVKVDVSGKLVVNGTVIISDSTINGNITVGNGGSLKVTGGTVNGTITVNGGSLEISGGNFSSNPGDQYLVKGKALEATDSGYTVVDADSEAEAEEPAKDAEQEDPALEEDDEEVAPEEDEELAPEEAEDPAEAEEPTYVVEPVVAKVGTEEFTSFAEAYAIAAYGTADEDLEAANDTVVLQDNVTITADDKISALRHNVTVDMNGYTLTIATPVTITSGTFLGNIELAEGASLAISGGTFSIKPADEWIVKGYGAFENSDGNYDVLEAAIVTSDNMDGKGESLSVMYKKGTNVDIKAVSKYTADDGDTYIFEGWYDGEKLVSVNNPYIFIATEDVTLTARYDKEVKDATVTISLTASRTVVPRKVGGNGVLTYKATRMVTGCTVKEAGIIYSTDSSIFGTEDANLEELLVKENSDVKIKKASDTVVDGYQTLNFTITSKNYDLKIYARAYVTVTYSNGTTETIYSNIVTGTYRTLK